MLPTSDDWDATNARPRSNRLRLLAGFAALLVAGVLIVVAVRFAWPAPSGPTKADGEDRLHSIVLPDRWRRSTITYSDSFWSPDTNWSEEIMASSADLDEVADTLKAAVRAAGFSMAGCQQYNPNEWSCAWYAEGYSLTGNVSGFAPLLEAPCPTGMSECSQISLTLTHRSSG